MKSELQLQQSGGRRAGALGRLRKEEPSWETGEEAVPTPSTGRAPGLLLSRELLFWPFPPKAKAPNEPGPHSYRKLL